MIASEAEAYGWLRALPEWTECAGRRLERLVELLIAENGRQNLIAAASIPAVWQRHIADSAQLLRFANPHASPWLDLGTGAGFPGLVISILRPDCEVVMVESRSRRVEWLQRACADLELTEAKVLGSSLEKVASRRFATISARAFAPLERLLELSARFSTADTQWLLPKGRSAQQELDDLRGWRHMFHVEQSLTDADAGVIVGTLAGRDKSAGKGKRT